MHKAKIVYFMKKKKRIGLKYAPSMYEEKHKTLKCTISSNKTWIRANNQENIILLMLAWWFQLSLQQSKMTIFVCFFNKYSSSPVIYGFGVARLLTILTIFLCNNINTCNWRLSSKWVDQKMLVAYKNSNTKTQQSNRNKQWQMKKEKLKRKKRHMIISKKLCYKKKKV